MENFDKIIQNALLEDIGTGDITSIATIAQDAEYEGVFLAKADGVVAGLEVMQRVFAMINEKVEITPLVEDGARVKKGDHIALAKGPGRWLLTGERVALNFMQRMSGIATQTRKMMDEVEGTKAIILDTRKTVPGLRNIDKWAVRLGGGMNHRMRLDDMVMIKDNHIEAAGSISRAVRLVRMTDGDNRPIEVEVKNIRELREALPLKVDRIMLDNMSTRQMKRAVEITNGATPLEASGNVTLKSVARIAKTGVDFISSGALTHSVTALDISFDLKPSGE